MVEIVIADDHPLVIEGVEQVLRKGAMDVSVVKKVSSGKELMEILEQIDLPDLLILDIAMPDKNGLDMLKEINQKYKELPVLMLSMHPEERFAVRSIKAGAHGYLNKASITQKLLEAIDRIVNKNQRYISETVAEQLAMELNGVHGGEHEKLSDREFQVMCMIASGKEIKEIAEELSLSDRTIHTYRSRLMEKLNLNSNVEITHYALAENLIEGP